MAPSDGNPKRAPTPSRDDSNPPREGGPSQGPRGGQSPAESARFSILLVEDDVDLREALVESLRDEGYAVDCAGDGEQALTYLRQGGRPGLILLDLMMPRMSGSEFRMAQKADPTLRHLPVVLLSADARMEERARALEVQGAIRKPIDLDELLAVIERYRAPAVNRTSA